MRLTLEDRDELRRRADEIWRNTRRSWDCHEMNRFIAQLTYWIPEGNVERARSAIERAMKHGLPADDMLKKLEER